MDVLKFPESVKNYLKDSPNVLDNFFVITSNDDLDVIIPRIYGYAITENEIAINLKNYNKEIAVDSPGCYVQIKTDKNKIEIQQDYFGCFGLYLYQSGDFFAISNSFLFLITKLKNLEVNINKDFLAAFANETTAILSGYETLLSEVKILPRNSYFVIDKNTKSFNIQIFHNTETNVPINSREGIELLDKWHNKWNNIINSLLKAGEYVSCDISGGKYSRAAFSCLFKDNLDLDSIQFNSSKGDVHTLSEDYQIATQISKIKKIELNKISSKSRRIRISSTQSLINSLLAKGGFHKELMCQSFYENKPRFNINGMVADLRDFWAIPVSEFIDDVSNRTKFNTINSRESTEKILRNTIDTIESLSPKEWFELEHTAKDYFYRNVRMRHQYGRVSVEFFLSNIVSLSPLLDPILYKLDQKISSQTDYDLIYAVIYDRYLEDLENVPFDSNREVISATRNESKKINQSFPFKKIEKKIQYSVLKSVSIVSKESTDVNTPLDSLIEIFKSEPCKELTNTVLGDEAYKHALKYLEHHKYHSYVFAAGLVEIYSILYILMFNNLIKMAKFKDANGKSFLYHNNGILSEIFKILESIRIDIKNIASNTNSVSILRSNDSNVYIETPIPLKSKFGNSKIIQSRNKNLILDFSSDQDGEIEIRIASPYINIDNQILPIKTDINYFRLFNVSNNQLIINIDEQLTVTQRKLKILKIKYKKGDKLRLETAWFPFIYSQNEVADLISKMYQQNIKQYLFWNVSK